MNVFASFDEILQDIKETKSYGQEHCLTFGWTDMKTVYPPTNTVCRDMMIIAYGNNKAWHLQCG